MPEFKRAVFISIKPKYCYQIFTGEKTIEVRKNYPLKLKPPFDVYVYCTAPSHREHVNAAMTVSDDELYVHPKSGLKYGSSIELMCCDFNEYSRDNFSNGKCIGKFTVYGIQRLRYPEDKLVDVIDAKESCLTPKELINYANGNPVYGWYIKDYELFGHPFTAKDFPTFKTIERPPQSWQYINIDTDALNARKQYITADEYEERDRQMKKFYKSKGINYED